MKILPHTKIQLKLLKEEKTHFDCTVKIAKVLVHKYGFFERKLSKTSEVWVLDNHRSVPRNVYNLNVYSDSSSFFYYSPWKNTNDFSYIEPKLCFQLDQLIAEKGNEELERERNIFLKEIVEKANIT